MAELHGGQRPLLPWGPKQPVDHRRLNEMQARAITDIHVAGPSVRMVRDGNRVSVLIRDNPPAQITKVYPIMISGPAGGGGKYYGYVYKEPPEADIDPATGFFSEIGVTGDQVLVMNTPEYNKATHDLTEPGGSQTLFLGRYWKTNSNGMEVYIIDGKDTQDCT